MNLRTARRIPLQTFIVRAMTEPSVALINERLECRLARANVLLHIGQRIASSQNLEAVLYITVEAISQHLHYDDVAIFLLNPEDPENLILRARGS